MRRAERCGRRADAGRSLARRLRARSRRSRTRTATSKPPRSSSAPKRAGGSIAFTRVEGAEARGRRGRRRHRRRPSWGSSATSRSRSAPRTPRASTKSASRSTCCEAQRAPPPPSATRRRRSAPRSTRSTRSRSARYERTKRLFAQQAATAQQLDQAERDYRVLEQQINAQDEQIAAQERQIAAQAEQIDATRAQQQTRATQVAAPRRRSRRWTSACARAEVTQPDRRHRARDLREGRRGRPAGPAALQDRQPRLGGGARLRRPSRSCRAVTLGQAAQVTVDAGGGQRQTLSGTVSWVSSQAEFTPTPIQTREERADLVYADQDSRARTTTASLKIGMPVDVQFASPNAGRAMTSRRARRRRRRRARRSGSARQRRWTTCRSRSRRRALRLHRPGRRRQDDAVSHPGDAARAGRGHARACSASDVVADSGRCASASATCRDDSRSIPI